MDTYCPKCGEPWEVLGITDMAEEFGFTPTQMHAKFRREGCEAFGESHNIPNTQTDKTYGLTRMEAVNALGDLLGDDVDGIASMMDEMGY